MLSLEFQFLASLKCGGSINHGRDSQTKRLGANRADVQTVPGG
ncbi:50S ribosomal protein L27, partial [Bacillus nitratireducens]